MKPNKYEWQDNRDVEATASLDAELSKGTFTMDEVKRVGEFLNRNKGLTYKGLARAFMSKAGL